MKKKRLFEKIKKNYRTKKNLITQGLNNTSAKKKLQENLLLFAVINFSIFSAINFFSLPIT